MNKLQTIIRRLSEPSTWAGVSVLMYLGGAKAGLPEAVAQGGAAVAGLLAVAMPEGAK